MITCGIYARVSSLAQNIDMQLPTCYSYVHRQEWKYVEYLEKVSSTKYRPVFEQMLLDAKSGKIQVILVYRVDRFARSIADFVNTTLRLKEWKVRLISATEPIDSGDETPFGQFTMHLLALLAQLEKGIINDRVRAGVAEAKRQGKHCGRPRKEINGGRVVWAKDEGGMGWEEIAEEMGVSERTVRRVYATSKNNINS